jgi:hypothetical protein
MTAGVRVPRRRLAFRESEELDGIAASERVTVGNVGP